MSHSPREYISGNLYEISFRAKKGLPLPPKALTELLILSAMARAQRDHKVHLCHFIWMANHPHLIVVIKDADACKRFYQELEKTLTESIKKLLGLKYLNLWKRRANVSRIGNVETAIERIAYAYNNPSKAHLVETIEEYPGLSSFAAFTMAENSLDARHTIKVPWIRRRFIEPLHSPNISERSDAFITDKLRSKAKKYQELVIEPNYWMKCFENTSEKDVKELNEKILFQVRGMESEFKLTRAKEGRTVLGVTRLKAVPFMRAHTPKTDASDRQVPILCSDKDLRIRMIAAFHAFCDLCRDRFREYTVGDYSKPWPPGGFRPPMMPTANAI